jgi:hypothetical protein
VMADWMASAGHCSNILEPASSSSAWVRSGRRALDADVRRALTRALGNRTPRVGVEGRERV